MSDISIAAVKALRLQKCGALYIRSWLNSMQSSDNSVMGR